MVNVNLRNIQEDFAIGLDMGTASVGWSAEDTNGQLLHFKGKPTWGSRLFDSASTAATARAPRSQRRRYVRRRWRLDLLQQLLQEEVEKVDPDFFTRLRQSRLVQADPNKTTSSYHWPLFNDSDFTEADYYKDFQTIYRLRVHLMTCEEKADIRLIYLALHNIVKCRGNFLREDQKTLSAKNAKADDAVEAFKNALEEWCDSNENEDISCGKIDVANIVKALSEKGQSPSKRVEEIVKYLSVSLGDASADKKFKKALANAMVGLQAEFKDIYGEVSAEKSKFSLSDEESVEKFHDACPDNGVDLFVALQGVYSAYLLQGLLSYAPGETISANMVAKYDKYHEDLKTLRALVRDYLDADAYNAFFRGEQCKNNNGKAIYDVAKAKGYTRYDLGKTSYDDFAKEVKALFKDTEAETDPRYLQMAEEFKEQRFLRRLKTSDNGSIYYQLHLEEMKAILDNQGRYYPVLKEQRDKILSLVTFRIPYYVGPLTQQNARLDKHGNARFAWSERKPGMENAAITPWNWESVIDKNASAEKFIKRMTGICTYLQGQDVLPKCSLLYEEYCVLNELNGMRWSSDGDKEYRFDLEQRQGIMQDICSKKKATYKDIENWLVQHCHCSYAHVVGAQGVAGMESKLSSYIFFAKDIFKTGEIAKSDYPMVEEIILWNTLFEDRSILKEKLQEKYGKDGEGRLSDTQIKAICKKRFTGWGRLSQKLLTGIKVDTQQGDKSIMDILRDGDPNADRRRGNAMVLMEILHNEDFGFQNKIDDFNRAYLEEAGNALGVNDLPGSPAIRRSINQAIKIVDEIVSIAGKAPKYIFVEVTRDDDVDKKGTRTTRRYNQLKDAIDELKDQDPQLWNQLLGELKNVKPENIDERIMLYFIQRGKCMYTGRAIDFGQLANSGLYEVDHIIPRAYIKDDSLENKVLVLREANQRKTDALLIDPAIRVKMTGFWKALHDAKVIGDKKFNNLLRDRIDENAMRGFIARQLVETSQMVKLVQSLLSVRYPDTKVIPIKASMSHNLREAANFIKCREANDFHHAHDAHLACCIGLFIMNWYPGIYERPIEYARAMQKYVREQSEEFKKTHHAPGSGGFIVGRFAGSFVDADTGEVWDGKEEIEKIRKTLNYRQCYITRMPYEDSGAFWNATIYSPHDSKMGSKLSLPLKENLDPQIYGGYSSQQFAYFFIYKAKDKSANTIYRFSQVPVWLALRIQKDAGALEEYAKQLASDEELEFISIQRAKILKRQLIEIDGDRLIITGAKEVRSGTELAFTQEQIEVMETIVKTIKKENARSLEKDEVNTLFKEIVSAGERNCGRLNKQLNLFKYEQSVENVSLDKLISVVAGLVKLFNGNDRIVDLSSLETFSNDGALKKGPANAGCMVLRFSELLNSVDANVYIIDQSVTGMFERRTRVGL